MTPDAVRVCPIPSEKHMDRPKSWPPASGAVDGQIVAAWQPRQVVGPSVAQTKPPVRQVGAAEAGQGQAGGRLARPGEVEGQAGKSGSALVVQRLDLKVRFCETPDRCTV